MPSAIGTALLWGYGQLGGALISTNAGVATAAGTTAAQVGTAALTATSLATTTGSQVYSAVQQRKAQAAEARRYEAQQRIAKIRDAKERTREVRLARIQRAKNIQAGQVSGSEQSGTSGLQGVLASAGTQQAANLAFRNQVGALQSQVAQEDMNIFDARGKQQVAGAIGQVSGTIFDIYGGARQMGKNMAMA